jgi:hypothetical protein
MAAQLGASAELICTPRWSSIRLQVGETQLPVKTEPRLGHGRTMVAYTAITLLKGIVDAVFGFSLVLL